MPRHASEHSCATCRQRKIKCDEARPVCLNCQRVHRECRRSDQEVKFVLHSANPQQQKFSIVSQVLQNENIQQQEQDRNALLEAKSLISSVPTAALKNEVIATLFRHYLDILAPWYDLNDSQSLFSTLVPHLSLTNPILFKAVIAFSACHESRTSSGGRYQDLGHVYHAACVRDLLGVLNDVNPEIQGDDLASTCLLRSYEILNGDTRQQQHLLGVYSFASSSHIDLTLRGLSQSGTWNYLREEITMALELRRPVRMGAGFEFVPSKDMNDDMWANYMSYILARIIDFCFDDVAGMTLEDRNMTWQELNEEVSAWRTNQPESFNPFSIAPKSGNAFPSIWLLQPWHVAGEQYLCIAEILLALFKPDSDIPQLDNFDREVSHPGTQDQVLKVCGLAFTNENVAARVNAFGPLAFCGRYLTQNSHRDALVSMLQDFSVPTGWPVQPIIEDLRQH